MRPGIRIIDVASYIFSVEDATENDVSTLKSCHEIKVS